MKSVGNGGSPDEFRRLPKFGENDTETDASDVTEDAESTMKVKPLHFLPHKAASTAANAEPAIIFLWLASNERAGGCRDRHLFYTSVV